MVFAVDENQGAPSRVMGSKSKSKVLEVPVHFSSPRTLTNSAFQILSATGLNDQSPAGSSKSVHVQPDLDLVSGFAFLSFASLVELETHIERNETTSGTISISIGVKKKVDSVNTSAGKIRNPEVPQKQKTASSVNKKPTKNVDSLASNDAKSKSRGKLYYKQQVVQGGSFLTEFGSVSKSVDTFAKGNDIIVPALAADSELSLLCSETVDLADDEVRQEDRGSDVNHTWVGTGDCVHTESPCQILDKIVQVETASAAQETNLKHKKKRKKRKHCDQTSQTKFRIKKKKTQQPQIKEELFNTIMSGFNNDKLPSGIENSVFSYSAQWSPQEGIDDGKNMSTQDKTVVSMSKIEQINWCARTGGADCYSKYQSWKNLKVDTVAKESQIDQSVEVSRNGLMELAHTKRFADEMSLESFSLNGSDQEIDIGDESVTFSLYSELSDHSSDLEPLHSQGCFLLNKKIEVVRKVETEQESDVVDVETFSSDVKKNFLVVSGIETGPTGHFSFHPDVTKEGTIDTSIQAYANEINIFTKCAMMQEGEVIKVISPDDSYRLQSFLSQKSNRDPDAVKASRSATERKRRHHIGDLFNDLKLEVFTDLVDADLYFSKQTILSKGIGTIEELERDFKDIAIVKEQLVKENNEMRKKRNALLFGEPSVTVDESKVEAILKDLDINIEDVKNEDGIQKEGNESTEGKQNTDVNTSNQSKAVPAQSIKGRPRAKKTLLFPWQASNGSKQFIREAEDEPKCEASVESPCVTHLLAGSSKMPQGVKIPNVSFGNQGQKLNEVSSSLKAGNPNESQMLTTDKRSTKCSPLDSPTEQGGTKLGLVKIAPKPTVVCLNPLQQQVGLDSLGQVKQPSSDKIICNLSRLSAQENTSKSSNICIIRSGQLMKTMESKNVMHIKIANDSLKQADVSTGAVPESVSLDPPKSQVTSKTSLIQITRSDTNPHATCGVLDTTGSTSRSISQAKASLRMSCGEQQPLWVAGGQLPVTQPRQVLSKENQTNQDLAIRALASLNKLQVKSGISHAKKQTDLVENPVASIFSGLKNFTRTVGSEGIKGAPSSTDPQISVLTTTSCSVRELLDTPVSVTASPNISLKNIGQTVSVTVSSPTAASRLATVYQPSASCSFSEQDTTTSGVMETSPMNFVSAQFPVPTTTLTTHPFTIHSGHLGVENTQVYDPFVEAIALVSNERKVPETTCASVLTKDMLPTQATCLKFSSTCLELPETCSPSPPNIAEVLTRVKEYLPSTCLFHGGSIAPYMAADSTSYPPLSCTGNVPSSFSNVEGKVHSQIYLRFAVSGE